MYCEPLACGVAVHRDRDSGIDGDDGLLELSDGFISRSVFELCTW